MATNDITGDALRSKAVTDSYRENFDLIFAKDKHVNDKGTDSVNCETVERTRSEANHAIHTQDGKAG